LFDWSAHVEAIAFARTAHHQRCRDFSAVTAELSTRLFELCGPHADEVLDRGDLVHGDFATDNVLVAGDSVSIIDSQDVGRGTRVIDLATMAVHCTAWEVSESAVAPFLEAAVAVDGLGVARICAAVRALVAVVHAIDHYPDFADTLGTRLLPIAALLR
jgi:Ser/Thr protein kinase RdoA (MazF antagonist)